MVSLLGKAQTPEDEKKGAAPLTVVACSLVHAIPGRVRFRVPKMARDPRFTRRLQRLIESDARVTGVRVSSAAASIAISYEINLVKDAEMHAHLVRLIQSAGVENIVETGFIRYPSPWETEKPGSLAKTEKPGFFKKPGFLKPFTGGFLSGEESEWSGLKLPALATALAVIGGPLGLPVPGIAIGATVAAAGLPVAKRAFESIRKSRRFNIDCMDLMAITLTSFQGNLLTPALVMTLHEIGDIIRDRTARSSRLQALDLLDSLAHFAWVERDGQKQQVPVGEVRVGDTVIVYPGEQIPVDGEVLRGKALIDQQKLTGESVPVVREAGQTVYASTLVREGEIYIKAERVGAATRAGASIKLVEEAPVYDTRMENYAANIADRAIVPALLLAGGVWAATGSPARAASILTLDFVTGMRVSMPTTYLAALTHATRHGILIRSGRALEQLAKVDTIVFDKTGTLTEGDIAVVAVETVTGRMSEARLLELAAAAEQRLTHPVALAVMRCAEKRGVRILPRGEWNYEVGMGVRAVIDGETVLVGSARFLEREGISLECFYDRHLCIGQCDFNPNCPISASSSLIFVAGNGEFQGVLQYTDPLRKESRSVIEKLQTQYGMEIHLLTGDSQKKALAVANDLGIPLEAIYAEAFPEQKAEIVRKLHDAGKTVAFTGDGLNDSVALAYADVSISFANGSEVARETADVVLMNNDLSGLLEAIAIAKQTVRVVKQNTVLAVAPNLAGLGLASTVGLHPLVATAVHNGSAIAAGLNGLRPLASHHWERA
jgi:Cu2+-exporting ATPase